VHGDDELNIEKPDRRATGRAPAWDDATLRPPSPSSDTKNAAARPLAAASRMNLRLTEAPATAPTDDAVGRALASALLAAKISNESALLDAPAA
jgi:hypothetical protein